MTENTIDFMFMDETLQKRFYHRMARNKLWITKVQKQRVQQLHVILSSSKAQSAVSFFK